MPVIPLVTHPAAGRKVCPRFFDDGMRQELHSRPANVSTVDELVSGNVGWNPVGENVKKRLVKSAKIPSVIRDSSAERTPGRHDRSGRGMQAGGTGRAGSLTLQARSSSPRTTSGSGGTGCAHGCTTSTRSPRSPLAGIPGGRGDVWEQSQGVWRLAGRLPLRRVRGGGAHDDVINAMAAVSQNGRVFTGSADK